MAKRKIKNLSLAVAFVVGLNIFLPARPARAMPITAENIIAATNQARAKNKIPSLTANQLLSQAAWQKALFIFQTKKFQHNFSQRRFSAWVRDSGYQYNYVGENLAIYFHTTESVIKAWLASPLHRQNILNPVYSEIGVAVVKGKFKGYPAILVVQIFAQPAFGAKKINLNLNAGKNFIRRNIAGQKIDSNLSLKTKQTKKLAALAGSNIKLTDLLAREPNKYQNKYQSKANTFFVHYQNFQSLKTFFFVYFLFVFYLWWIGRFRFLGHFIRLYGLEATKWLRFYKKS